MRSPLASEVDNAYGAVDPASDTADGSPDGTAEDESSRLFVGGAEDGSAVHNGGGTLSVYDGEGDYELGVLLSRGDRGDDGGGGSNGSDVGGGAGGGTRRFGASSNRSSSRGGGRRSRGSGSGSGGDSSGGSALSIKVWAGDSDKGAPKGDGLAPTLEDDEENPSRRGRVKGVSAPPMSMAERIDMASVQINDAIHFRSSDYETDKVKHA